MRTCHGFRIFKQGSSDVWYVYVLEQVLSPSQPILGCTNRLWETFRKEIETRQARSRAFLPLELVYYEAYMTERAARTRLKNLERYDDLRLQLKEQIAGRSVTQPHPSAGAVAPGDGCG